MEGKVMMDQSSSDNCGQVYSIKILNIFNPEWQLINTKTVIKTSQNTC